MKNLAKTPASRSQLFLWLSAWAPVVVWAIIIFTFSAQPQLPGFDISALDFVLKKMGHVFVYAVLYFFVFRALNMSLSKHYDSHLWWIAMILVLCYAMSDEFHQSFVANRTASPRDVGYDILGASIVMLRLHNYV